MGCRLVQALYLALLQHQLTIMQEFLLLEFEDVDTAVSTQEMVEYFVRL